MKTPSTRGVVLALAAACLTPTISHAQATEAWKFQASVYAYLPSVGGTTTFPGAGGGSSVTVDASTIVDSLKFTVMGTFEAQRGSWGLFTDVIYLNLGDSKSQSRAMSIGGALPAGATADVNFDMKGWLLTFGGSWQPVTTQDYRLDVIGGLRLIDLNQSLDWRLSGNIGSIALPDRAGSRSVGTTNWDAIVGIKGEAKIVDGDKWFVPFYVDIGTGESKFTWQTMLGVGYSFGWGDVVGVWRYIDYEMKSGKPIESVRFSGPTIAAVFRW